MTMLSETVLKCNRMKVKTITKAVLCVSVGSLALLASFGFKHMKREPGCSSLTETIGKRAEPRWEPDYSMPPVCTGTTPYRQSEVTWEAFYDPTDPPEDGGPTYYGDKPTWGFGQFTSPPSPECKSTQDSLVLSPACTQ